MNLNLDETVWTIAEGRTPEYNFEIRFREFREDPPTAEYGQCLNIFWEFRSSLDNGFPDKDELEKLHEFENRLIGAVEHDEFSIMSMVLTGNRTREFVFHTSDPHEFINRLSQMPQEKEAYPIEINLYEDLHWDYYYVEVANIKSA